MLLSAPLRLVSALPCCFVCELCNRQLCAPAVAQRAPPPILTVPAAKCWLYSNCCCSQCLSGYLYSERNGSLHVVSRQTVLTLAEYYGGMACRCWQLKAGALIRFA